ncbi:DUF3857 domain-containing protein [Maribacter hydrothermalis]|uniref:DUF3857 domain-containing protein n=1 Tax=Maribacter hydrothermalis TaxID=1836467 RepID=A0A1B7ZDR6_9FLAO|nr:DUF3857 and transglutaminase domain-containing protein [Maribacter hydrothermalis]APQ16605.1 hypothetical protein BTR34_04325 [Maribacter hydrothermalis]OBR41489.1 hypothetical protein A9200_12710 [Maribacter hydrothermalis]
MRILLVLFFLTITQTAVSQEYNFSKIDSALLKNADAVVRLDQMNILVKSSDFMEITSTRAVTVINEKGSKHVSAMAFYDKETAIKNLVAIIYDANGEEIEKFKEKDFKDQTATGEGTLYSDSRVKFLKYTPVDYPYTIVLEKKYTTSDTAFMPRWYFLDGYRISVEKSEFSLSVPVEIKYRFKDNNLESFKIEGTNNTNGVKYSATNLRALESEDFDPEFVDFTPNVQLALNNFHLKGIDGYATSWKEFGSWIYNSLLVDRGELNTATIQKVQQLVKGIEDEKEIIKKVYQFVQDNTRYISVQMGIGGWMPINADEVDRVKYGDCKGLTNYTMSLLKAVGIESFYTIVSADARMKSLDYDFPSLQGNHAFLNVPLENEEIWLECTSQEVPANFLGTFTDNRYVLKVGPNGGEMVKSRHYRPEQSKQTTKAKIQLGESVINAQVEIKSSGIQYNQKYGLANDSKEDIEKYYKNYWDYVNAIQIQSHELINNKDSIVTTEKVNFKTMGYLSKAGDRILFAPNMLNRNAYVPKRDNNRKREVVIKRGYLDEDDFIIELPKGFTVEANLKPTKINNEFGEYEVTVEHLSENKIRYKRRLLMKSGSFPKTSYEDYREFRKTISRVDSSKIVLIKK